MPTTTISMAQLQENANIVDLMVLCGLCKSKGEARRLIQGGGVSVNDQKVGDIAFCPDEKALQNGAVIRKGKKVYHRVVLKA